MISDAAFTPVRSGTQRQINLASIQKEQLSLSQRTKASAIQPETNQTSDLSNVFTASKSHISSATSSSSSRSSAGHSRSPPGSSLRHVELSCSSQQARHLQFRSAGAREVRGGRGVVGARQDPSVSTQEWDEL